MSLALLPTLQLTLAQRSTMLLSMFVNRGNATWVEKQEWGVPELFDTAAQAQWTGEAWGQLSADRGPQPRTGPLWFHLVNDMLLQPACV